MVRMRQCHPTPALPAGPAVAVAVAVAVGIRTGGGDSAGQAGADDFLKGVPDRAGKLPAPGRQLVRGGTLRLLLGGRRQHTGVAIAVTIRLALLRW